MSRSFISLAFVSLFAATAAAGAQTPRPAPAMPVPSVAEPVPPPEPAAAPLPPGVRGQQTQQPPRTAPPAPAQTPTAAPPAVPSPAVPNMRNWPAQNVRIDVTITDTFGTTPTKKTITMLVGENQMGRIRSSIQLPMGNGLQSLIINVDATPRIFPPGGHTETAAALAGRIVLDLTVQYTPEAPAQQGGSQRVASLDESMSVLLTDGKSTLVSQSADPQGDRKVTLEVTATVVK